MEKMKIYLQSEPHQMPSTMMWILSKLESKDLLSGSYKSWGAGKVRGIKACCDHTLFMSIIAHTTNFDILIDLL